MTVKELIGKLSALTNQDAPVAVYEESNESLGLCNQVVVCASDELPYDGGDGKLFCHEQYPDAKEFVVLR